MRPWHMPALRAVLGWVTSAACHAAVLVLVGLAFAPAVPQMTARAPIAPAIAAHSADLSAAGWEPLNEDTGESAPLDPSGALGAAGGLEQLANVESSAVESTLLSSAAAIDLNSDTNSAPFGDIGEPTGFTSFSDRVSVAKNSLSAPIIDENPGGKSGVRAGGGLGGNGKGALGFGKSGSTFFGVQSYGKNFVYIVDISGSMSGAPFERAKTELIRAIQSLEEDQKFFIFFFNTEMFPHPDHKLVAATPENIKRTLEWIDKAFCTGFTDPLPSLTYALGMEPDAIYLLTDGVFEPTTPAQLTQIRTYKPVPIHTIGFLSNEGESLLVPIAKNSGGMYRHIAR